MKNKENILMSTQLSKQIKKRITEETHFSESWQNLIKEIAKKESNDINEKG